MTTAQNVLPPFRPSPAPSEELAISLRRPGDLLCPGGVIFSGLERAIKRHLFQLRALGDAHPRAPRILVITGRPGTGKTVAATDAALRMNHAVLQVPASELASENEGGASAVLDAYFRSAVRHSHLAKEPVAVVADDLDLGIIGADAETGRTINSNLLVQRIQAFADNDECRAFDGSRLALIVSGNDFSNCRSSLFRDGRATWYEHDPSPEEITDVVLNLFAPRTPADRRLLLKLAHRYRKESVAFWSAVYGGLRDDVIDGLIASGITDPITIKIEMHRSRPLEPVKLLKLARHHARHRRLSFLK